MTLIVATVLLSAVAISFLSQKGIEQAVAGVVDQHARDLLDAVMLNVESEYKSYQFHKQTTLDRRKSELTNIVDLAMSYIDEAYADYRAQRVTLKKAQQTAMDRVRLLRYDHGVGYLWINDDKKPVPRMLMHPTLPQLDGEVLDNRMFNTASGHNENLFSASVRVTEKFGAGYIDYLWPKPTPRGLTAQQPKISYVKLFEPWRWIVGTGVYIDDIELEAQRRLGAIVEELRQTFAHVRVADTGYMFIFNGKKEMLIHPTTLKNQLRDMKNPITGDTLVDELIAQADKPQHPFEYLWDKPEKKGDYRYLKRAYVRYFEPLDWYIVSTMYVDEIDKPVQLLRQRTLYLTVFVLIIAYFLSLYLVKTITSPLSQLTLVAREIGKDGLADVKVPIGGTTETRELGIVLDQMMHSICEAETDLRQVNRDLESFAYTVSHDLRTLLTPIVGYAQILRDQYQQQLDDQAMDYLTEIERHSDKMLSLMEDLLDLAKVGHVERPLLPVATAEIVSEVIADLTSELIEKQGRVEMKALPNVHLPSSALSQLFANLIGNAVHYALNADNSIEVGGYRRNRRVRFYVRDHGPGISDDEKSQVFEVFYRGLTGKDKSGTGIGLATVQKIARYYGGRSWVVETEGGGATFWVEVVDEKSANQPE
ncbi:MAG: cache domain-containing protein [Desulfuromonas sp.]|nr:cache domain-containing protein [Desulfuromonas sp.]